MQKKTPDEWKAELDAGRLKVTHLGQVVAVLVPASETENHDPKHIAKHLLFNFLLACIGLGAAFVLGYVESHCAEWKFPEYICIGAKIIAIVLFVADGVVICGVAIVGVIRFFRTQVQFLKKRQ